MKKLLFLLPLLLTLATLSSLALMPAAMAATCNGVETSIDFECNTHQTDSISAIIMYVINFMAIGVGIAVVAGIVWGGLTYARAGGDSSVTKQGMDMIRNAIIGLVLFIFMYAAADFLIPGGAFNLNDKVATPAKTAPPKTDNDSKTNDKAATASLAKITSVNNIRDAGTGGVIKTGLLYRSGNLNDLSAADKKELESLLKGGIIIDLRRSSDKGFEKDPNLSGVTEKQIAIKGEASADGYVKTFIKDADARKQFASALTTIANANGPVLIHCKHGKDRTGWLAALVMMASGATKAEAKAEYLKSPKVDAAWFDAAYKAAQKASSNGKISGFLTDSVSKGGLGLSASTVATLKKKFAA